MAKVGISSDIIKPFSGQGDVLAWLKKVRLVAKLEQLDNVASVLALYLDGDTLAVYMEIEEEEEEEEEEGRRQRRRRRRRQAERADGGSAERDVH